MSILRMSLAIPPTRQSLSSAEVLSCGPISAQSLCLTTKFSQLSLAVPTSIPYKPMPIRLGGGPRTYPGGVSKRRWQRMQAKKAKELLKAGLVRERQIYERRKRAELKAAVSELERPWERVEKPPNSFSVSADEQLKVLTDRVQKPDGLDLWSEKDRTELFRLDNGLSSARLFPKGVVHSIKPYRKTEILATTSKEIESSYTEEDSNHRQFSGNVEKMGPRGNGYDIHSRSNLNRLYNGRDMRGYEPRSSNGVVKEDQYGNFKGQQRKKGNTRMHLSDSGGKSSGDAKFYNR